MPIRVTVWNEFRHEVHNPTVKAVYPEGIHAVIKRSLEAQLGDEVVVRTATLDEPDHGLSDEVIASTDVMLWWGHWAHADVKDEIAAKVVHRVLNGMGLVVLHSAHYAKPFRSLMGTGCHIKWRVGAEKERLWIVSPGHPLTAGIESDHIYLPQEEMYGEHFDIPTPDELVFVSWFEGGEICRSGCVWRRGAGRVFYFRPGHEVYKTYYNPEVMRVIANGVKYVAPVAGSSKYRDNSPHLIPPLEAIQPNDEQAPSLRAS